MLDRDYYNKYIRQYYAFGYHDGDFDYEEKSLKAKIEISDNIEVIKECKKKLEALNLVQTQRRKGFYYGYDSYGDIVLKRDVKNNHNDIFDYLPQIILLIFIVIYL